MEETARAARADPPCPRTRWRPDRPSRRRGTRGSGPSTGPARASRALTQSDPGPKLASAPRARTWVMAWSERFTSATVASAGTSSGIDFRVVPSSCHWTVSLCAPPDASSTSADSSSILADTQPFAPDGASTRTRLAPLLAMPSSITLTISPKYKSPASRESSSQPARMSAPRFPATRICVPIRDMFGDREKRGDQCRRVCGGLTTGQRRRRAPPAQQNLMQSASTRAAPRLSEGPRPGPRAGWAAFARAGPRALEFVISSLEISS